MEIIKKKTIKLNTGYRAILNNLTAVLLAL